MLCKCLSYFNKNCNPSLSFDTHNEIKPLKDLRVYAWCSGKDLYNSRIIDITKNTVILISIKKMACFTIL